MALMDETERPVSAPPQKYLTVRQAAFIGVGAMVGAGIFALLGAAGEVAGAAVWLSFLIAGAIAALAGLFVRQARRPLPVGRGPARVRRARASATATSPASPPG